MLSWPVALVFLLFLASPALVPASFAEPRGNEHGGSGESTTRRAAAADTLKDQLPLLQRYSGLDADALVDLFGISLPEAITAAVKEKTIHPLVGPSAKFASYLHADQLKFMKTNARDAITDELKNEPHKRNERQIVFLRALVAAAKTRLGETPETEEETAFAKSAEEEFKTLDQKSEELREKIKLLRETGDKKAKEELLGAVNSRALLGYLNAQMKSSSKKDHERAQALGEALAKAEKDKQGGTRYYLDTQPTGSPEEGQRLWLGKTAEETKSLLQGLEAQGQIAGQRLSGKESTLPKREFFPSAGGAAAGAPPGFASVKQRRAQAEAARKKAEAESTTAANAKSQQAARSAVLERVETVVTSSCNGCHATKALRTAAGGIEIQYGDKPPSSFTRALAVARQNSEMSSLPALAELEDLKNKLGLP